ncbi:hypothetical protein ZOSMA_164G00220 [Zostera marina]|uniref:3'-5' exonuclease domain-containing protein n=1 Tax=Zostera marina TaxID=29655 RepID=A0A0K9PW10_ZOSMR|nr:hypothetical protein ZOSMA_164G00220 [Zostera marina]
MSPITIENTDETYTVFTVSLNSKYQILTTVTSTAATVEAWIDDVNRVYGARGSNIHVGLDVEWRPSYGGPQNKVSVFQLCTGNRCLIFQLLYADRIPAALNEFLVNPCCRFLGVGIEEDIEKLVCDWDFNSPVSQSKVDLRVLAENTTGKKEMKQMGVKKLAMEIIGMDVYKPKTVTMSRWDNECLSLEQIKYACVDAFLSFLIGDRLYSSK